MLPQRFQGGAAQALGVRPRLSVRDMAANPRKALSDAGVDVTARPVLAKASAYDEAYAAGFTKAAEAMGLDPVELLKAAAAMQVAGAGVRAAGGKAKTALEKLIKWLYAGDRSPAAREVLFGHHDASGLVNAIRSLHG